MKLKVKGANTLKGLKGNLRFVLLYKFWAATLLFLAGLLVGFLIWGSAVAFAHPGRLDSGICHQDHELTSWHYHFKGSHNVAGLCDGNGPLVAPAQEILDRLDHVIHLMETFDSTDSNTKIEACKTLSERVKGCSRNCSMTFLNLYAETCGGKQ